MTDQYYSRLLSIAKQNKGVKFIKDIKDNRLYVEMNDGSSGWLNWEEVFDYKKIIKNEKSL